jgi:uncharacterized protein YjbI with pentapeptide repeats
MNRQPARRSVLHTLLSVLTRKAPEQAKHHVQLPRRPAPDDHAAWRAYWKEQGQPWRKEPEIDTKRQQELSKCRIIIADIEKGIYPFRGMKLSRADVEWLLSTHESGGIRGPVDWSDERQRTREGLDVRGAHLQEEDLTGLPLARIRGGLTSDEWFRGTKEQREMAAVHLQKANLREANLQKAGLLGANLQKADLVGANLQEANLRVSNLQKADLVGANLQKASLRRANLQKASLIRAQLQGADLEGVTFGNEKQVGPQLADSQWSDVNLAVIEWTQVKILGDEYVARQKWDSEGKTKGKQERLSEYEAATRANRQLAVILREQGLNEKADHFAYRAQVLQKTVFRRQMLLSGVKFRQRVQALGALLFSWFLFLLAGYGYKPWRSFLAYLLVIGTFMALYLLLDPCLAWYEAIVVSMTAFHGRGFSPSTFSPGDPLSIASAVEAFVGLIIEVTFIATLTRRFFGQ